ncbi:MAG TPA: hypothetical protein VEB40_07235 [Flavipsychrobacter sp.]|nr:hypothetical protein [Flavipsychrobacter sp.]
MPLLLLSVASDFLTWLFIFLAVFFICVFITRWIFGIPIIIKNLRVQTANQKMVRKVITELALKQGMSKEELDKIEIESIQEVFKQT